MELNEIREKIDALDREIQTLFEQRMLLCQDVARYKQAHHMPVFQASREEQVLQQVERRATDGLAPASRTFFANMMSISSQLQQKMLDCRRRSPGNPFSADGSCRKSGLSGHSGRELRSSSTGLFSGTRNPVFSLPLNKYLKQ